MKKVLYAVVFFLISFQIGAQTFIGATGAIVDNQCQEFSATAEGLTGAVRFKSINFSLTHTFDGDLVIYLIAPDGTAVGISFNNGGDQNNYTNTTIDVDATTSISDGVAPYTGSYLPQNNLGVLDGINLNGTWKLKICDTSNLDDGYLDNWSITFSQVILPDFISLQPEIASTNIGENAIISSQILKVGLTDSTSGQAPGIEAWLGYSTTNTNPRTWTNWIPAPFNQELENNDEYQLPFGSLLTPPGTYYYTMRFKINNSFYFFAGTNNGLWDGVTHGNGVLTLNPATLPANNDCSGAIPLNINSGYICETYTSGSVVGATPSAVDGNSCGGSEDDDVWFSFIAPAPALVLSFTDVVGSTTDLYHSLWSGANCLLLNFVSGSCSNSNESTISGLVVGQIYYLRVYTFSGLPFQTTRFKTCVTGLAPPPDLVSLQLPATATIFPGESITIYGEFYEPGLTDINANQAPNVQAWIGYKASNNTAENPFPWINWIPATFHQKVEGKDVYKATIGENLSPGSYTYVTRFKLANGIYYFGGINPNNNQGFFWNGTTYKSGLLKIRPFNDDCDHAIPLTVGSTFDDFPLTGTLSGASDSVGFNIACDGSNTTVNSGVYYSAVVPASGSLAIETKGVSGSSLADTVVVSSIGNCDQLIGMACNDNLFPTQFSRVVMFSQTPGDVLRISVYKKGTIAPTTDNGWFQISAYVATLGTDSFDNTAFSYSPNPVKDILNLSYSKEIATVEVFNGIGQKVHALNNRSSVATVDMTSLSNGIYMVRITSDNQSKTIKIIKE